MEVKVFTLALRNKIEFGRFSLETDVKVHFVKTSDLKSNRKEIRLSLEKLTVEKK